MNWKVTTSSELMENYLQADFLSPQEKFIALQTDAGASLLFSIGTAGALYLTYEAPGQTQGWRQVDLSAARIASDSGGKGTVVSFGAAQRVAKAGSPAEIHLAMVVSDARGELLYLSLGNSDSDLSWTSAPVWTPAPFNALDATGKPIAAPTPFQIANIFLSEASDAEYIVADVIRNPGQPVGMLSRYYIDASNPSSPQWKLHDLAIDVQAAGYESCLGRAAHTFGVDGLYTKGQVGGSAQLIYAPLYNAFDPSQPPLPSRLHLPGGLVPDAIAAVRNDDNSSDLYVAAKGGLFWFASGNQKDGATAVQVASNALIDGMRALYAYSANGVVTVWGLNGSDEVIYLSCRLGSQSQMSAWNTPLPIVRQVDAISPFIDRAYSANTFFAHAGTGLIKAVKSPTTGLWSQRSIVLPASATTQASTAIHSYTTHIQVTDANGQAGANVPVKITASNVISVYINHLYYIVGPEPVEVATDVLGTVTIVEATTSLAGTRYQVVVADQPAIPISTMDPAWKRNAKYTSTVSLQSAKIVNRDGSSRPFIPAGTSAGDLDAVAKSNQSLNKAYASFSPSTMPAVRPPVVQSHAVVKALTGGGDGLLVDVGDFFSWLASGVEAAIDIVEDAAEGVWRFIAKIGDAIYHGILDCVEAVVAAATWVYNRIKIIVEDIIKFLEFLFEWQDILVTHRVLKNVFICLSEHAIDEIQTTKSQVADAFQMMQKEINNWADIPSFTQSANATLTSNAPLAGQNSAPANLGVHHFQNGCADSSSNIAPPTPAEAILQDLVKLMEAEGETLSAAVKAIKTDIIDQFSNLSVTDVIKRLLAILTDTILQSAENVIVTALDVFAQLLEGVIDILTAKLDIPVLSWLYKELTGEDLSFLDLVCLVAAIPVTLIYKATAQKAPFPENERFTKQLIGASNFQQIRSAFVVPRRAAVAAHSLSAAAGTGEVLDQGNLKIFAFATGIAAAFAAPCLCVFTNIQRAPFGGQLKTLQTINGVLNIAYISPNFSGLINAAIQTWPSQVNNAVTGVSLLKGLVAIPFAASDTAGKVFGFIESFINAVWNLPVIANIISNQKAVDSSYKSLVPESIGNFAFNVGGLLEFPIALVSDLKAKAILAAVQATFMLVYGACIAIAGGIYGFAPNQEH